MSAGDASITDTRASIGAAPIAPDNPAGADCRASPEFEALEAELRKLEVDGPNAVDWRKVEEGAIEITSAKSKDFLVAAWGAYALFRREGLAGLVVGVSILLGIVVTHWEDSFPPARRERARVASIEWLVGRLAAPIAQMKFQDADAANVVALFEGLRGIDEAMAAKLQKEQLSVAELLRPLRPAAEEARRSIAEATQRAEAEAKAAAAAAEAPAPSAQTEPAPPTTSAQSASVVAATQTDAIVAPSADASLPELNAAIGALAPALRAYAQSLRGQQPDDPRAYVLARIGSWLRIDELPATQNGRTLVTPPVESLEAIEAARAQKQWPVALASAEELIWTAPFCLDAHRHSFETLGEMGAGFAPARAGVRGLLRYFAQRHPGLLELTFKDGRPFADAATRELAVGSADTGGGQTSRDEMTVAITQARALFGSGKAAEALDALSQTLRRSTSGRQRAMWQLAQARFCFEQGFVAAALPLVEHLDRSVGERDLEHWEPDLAASIAELRLRTLMHSDAQSVLSEDRRRAAIEEARGRMARLDIGTAVRLLRA
jgi:type VI secretion system protein VasJ